MTYPGHYIQIFYSEHLISLYNLKSYNKVLIASFNSDLSSRFNYSDPLLHASPRRSRLPCWWCHDDECGFDDAFDDECGFDDAFDDDNGVVGDDNDFVDDDNENDVVVVDNDGGDERCCWWW